MSKFEPDDPRCVDLSGDTPPKPTKHRTRKRDPLRPVTGSQKKTAPSKCGGIENNPIVIDLTATSPAEPKTPRVNPTQSPVQSQDPNAAWREIQSSGYSTTFLPNVLIPTNHPNRETIEKTNPFCGPRAIPRFLNGDFVGKFLPQVQIPADHPRGDDIRRAADFLRASPAYKYRSDYIEHRIWILVGIDPSQVTHHAEAIAKCPTIRLGVSDECFTYCNPGANMNECPSFRATNACSDALPPTGIEYGNGLNFCVTNARILCRSKDGH